MSRALNIQTFGSLVVVGAFIASEAAAAYLSACPGSELAWYLNLAVFRPFEAARVETSPLRILFGPVTLPLLLGLAVATLGARLARFRLAVAAIANGCFACAAALAMGWLGGRGALQATSLVPHADLRGPDLAVIGVMLASSFFAAAVSHLSFVSRIRDDVRGAPVPSRNEP